MISPRETMEAQCGSGCGRTSTVELSAVLVEAPCRRCGTQYPEAVKADARERLLASVRRQFPQAREGVG